MKYLKLSIASLIICFFIFNSISDVEAECESIYVFDSQGQKLGKLVDASGGAANIYVESLDINIDIRYDSGDISDTYLLFTSTDCTGNPYSFSSASYEIIKNLGKYYIGEKVAPYSVYIESRLWMDGTCIQCSPAGSMNPMGCYKGNIDLVSLSEVALPFELPVALPLKYSTQTECDDYFTQTDLDNSYNDGYEAGLKECEECEECPESEVSTFNMFDGILQIPNLDLGGGTSYWVDLKMRPDGLLEIKDYGSND